MRANNSHSGVSMRLLLLNNNPAVSRLIKLSAEKAGYELDEFEDYGLVPLATYDVLLIDNELYDEASIAGLCDNTGCDYIVYICQRGAHKPESANAVLEKPFLPTDFLVLLDKVKNVIISHKIEATEEASKVLPSSEESEESNAFDIDQIDTLEIEEDMLPIHLLEEPSDVKEEEDEETPSLEDEEIDTLDLEQNYSLDALDEEQEDDKKLNLEDKFSFDEMDSVEKEEVPLLEDFGFEEESNSTVSLATEELEDEIEEECANPSILDKDDINEVKQLLDESEEDEVEETSDVSLDAFDLDKENEETGKFFFDDIEKEDNSLDKEVEPFDLELDDIPTLDFEETTPVGEEDLSVETPEEQEEIIDDFAEGIEEKIEEEKEMTFDDDTLMPHVDVALDTLVQRGEIDSLDDLNENLLKKAFGEEVMEEEVAPMLVEPEEKGEKIEVIRGEIESSIARSISGLAQSDILREALKGMRINISITFDEKE